jgi:hypothetical protein
MFGDRKIIPFFHYYTTAAAAPATAASNNNNNIRNKTSPSKMRG